MFEQVCCGVPKWDCPLAVQSRVRGACFAKTQLVIKWKVQCFQQGLGEGISQRCFESRRDSLINKSAYSSFHFLFHYPNIILPHITHYGSFHFLFHYPNIILPHITHYGSFHFLFHYPNIRLPLITHYGSFHFLFHYPNINPIYVSQSSFRGP